MAPGGAPSPNTAIGPDGSTRTVRERVARRVWVAAGGRCTLCNRYLLDDEATGQDVATGELAHIVGWTQTPGSPRGDDSLALEDRNLEANLMLLCHDQHRVIDSRPLWQVYDTQTLLRLKRAHEHRVRQLTALGEQDRCTVLRVVGSMHGAAAGLTASQVASALLAEDRFPDYALIGVDEFEVDLRSVPGEAEGRETYWAMARDLTRDRLERLGAHVAKERIGRIAVFPFARVPILIDLGAALDDAVPTDIFPKRRDSGEGWGWSPGAPDVHFGHRLVRQGEPEGPVAVVFSVSGTVDLERLPASPATPTIYEIHPVDAPPDPELIRSSTSLDNFARTWRHLLADLERHHPGVGSIDVFAAVPVTAAVAIGRGLMRAIHPHLRVYDRDTTDTQYRFALEVAP